MAKLNDWEEKKARAMWGGIIFLGGAFLLFLVFIGRILYLQNSSEIKEIEANIQSHYREDTVLAARGNLYASDGAILATTVIKYDVYIDFSIINDTVYKNNIGALTDSLSRMFGKPRIQYRNVFDKQKENKKQYYSLVKNLDFEQMNRLKTFPILGEFGKKTQKYEKNRCMIVEPAHKRILATNKIGAGTIGIDRGDVKSGLEGAFSKYLKGENGTRMVQKINATQWKPIGYWNIKDPVDGKDVYTTLDLRIQDIAHSALEKQLIEFDAHHGTVVVMEVETGKVRAMVNLRKDEQGDYVDAYNYAIKDASEPGSTFKVVSLLAAMDDGFIDENTTENTNGGVWIYAGQRITDSHKGGVYDISDILAQSSNVGTAKIIVKAYADNPKIFINHLKRWKMFDKMDIELPGIVKPNIFTPESKRWNKATLASLSFGYASSFSLLQLATFYNGIANKGKMVKPLFIDKIVDNGRVIYEAKPEVMVDKMATDKAIKMITDALTKAVEKGTAKSIYTPNLKMAGKTGTARFEYWKKGGPMKYQASFAGFYPSDNPKYTCIVMINQPQGNIYGGRVAAPAFKEIAGKTFLKTPLNVDQEMLKDKKVDLSKMKKSTPNIKISNKQMPDVMGFMGKSVIPQLENLGYRVEYKGVGKIIEQFPEAGTVIKKDQKIYLRLQ